MVSALNHCCLAVHPRTEMTVIHRIVALVVLLAVCLPVSGLVLAQAAGMDKAPAGCHRHGQAPHSPSSARYECCAAGHNTAVVPPVADPSAWILPVSRSADPLAYEVAGPVISILPGHFLSASPPTGDVLRI